MPVTTISPKQLAELCRSDSPVVIDVRTPVEFEASHCPYARNVPLDQLDARSLAAERAGSDRPVYFICRSGSRGKMACDKLESAGFANVVNVEGGTLAWEEAGLPVNRGRKAVSLERQVRIAAGSLVVVGVALGFLVHPVLFGLAGFVGAGLIFAGVTDTCGMGMVIARMPWNRRKAVTCSPPSVTG